MFGPASARTIGEACLHRYREQLAYRGFMPDVDAPRPDLRRPPRIDAAVYRVRIELDGSWPPIWRRIDVRSDLPLDVVHQVIQAGFGWWDYHLYRFSLGGRAFDCTSQLFLCPYDVANPEFEEDAGLPAADVRLDEVLQDAGDTLQYVYDYGDNWELTLRLEGAAVPVDGDSPIATLVDGKRGAPPEDCGHLVTAEELATVLGDPAHFPAEDIAAALRGAYFVSYDAGLDRRLIALLRRFDADQALVDALCSGPITLSDDELARCLRAHQWFLDRAVDGGITLTAAGYLKPADVIEASNVVPAMGDWIGVRNREMQSYPILHFRQSLQSMGLLRKYKGTLVLTKAGAAAQRDPEKLWNHLSQRLLPSETTSFEGQAGFLLLAFAGGASDGVVPFDDIASILTGFGWRHQDGRTLRGYEVRHLPQYDALVNVADGPPTRDQRARISSAAATLARAALRSAR